MNNGNKNIGNSELIALANRRREQMKKAEAERQSSPPPPQPKPQPQPQPKPQPKPQTAPQPKPQSDKKRERELQKRRAAAEKQRAAAEKQKREQEARVEKDKLAAKKRIERREKTEATLSKLSSLRQTYKGTLKNAGAYFVLFLCVLLIICTLSATVFLLSLMNYGERPETPKTVSFTTEGKNKKYDYAEIVRDGVYYINFSEIAYFCSFSQSGDSTTFIYSTAEGEQLKFTPPSRIVLVNGNSVTASADILCTDGELWVPADFISDYITGIELLIDKGTDADSGKPYLKITLSKQTDTNIGFALKYNSVLSGISNESLPEEPVTLPDDAPKYEYSADLSNYLKYMCPEDYDKHMILINPSNPVDETYIPDDLISVPNPRYDNGSSLCEDASKSLEALFIEMHTLGFRDMKVSIAYRSYEQQKHQFDVYAYNERYYYRTNYEKTGKWFSDEAYKVLGKEYLETKYISQGKTSLSADDAKRVAMSYSAYPGTGDHQTGLALDLYLPGYSGAKFAESDEYKWLVENAHKFGFIFRYPENKVNITGYSFEPVHLRFVGQYHAALIFETGLALEEYVSKYIN